MLRKQTLIKAVCDWQDSKKLGTRLAQVSLCELLEPHPATNRAPVTRGVTYCSTIWNDAGPHGKVRRGSTKYESLSEEGGGYAETAPKTRGRVLFADARGDVPVLHTGPSFSGDEGLGGVGVEEGFVLLIGRNDTVFTGQRKLDSAVPPLFVGQEVQQQGPLLSDTESTDPADRRTRCCSVSAVLHY